MRAWKTLIAIAGTIPLVGTGSPGAKAVEPSTYAARCASCHGEDGTAATSVGRALKIPSFKGSSFTREHLAKLLRESKSHAGIEAKLGEGDLDALVGTLNALADPS